MQKIKLGVVIPCYNEKANLPELVARCSRIVDPTNLLICLVDNGSRDGTSELLNGLALPNGLFVKKVPINLGYGHGILQGLKELDTEFIGWTHADLQTDPMDLKRALDILCEDNNIEFLKGIRCGRSLTDRTFTFFMTIFVLAIQRKFLKDINGQPTLMTRNLYESWENPPWDFSFDVSAFLHAHSKKARIERFYISFAPRFRGKSSWNSGFNSRLRLSIRTLKYLIKL
jgi:glycosyltransferase involved in cell wall biosynthesis